MKQKAKPHAATITETSKRTKMDMYKRTHQDSKGAERGDYRNSLD